MWFIARGCFLLVIWCPRPTLGQWWGDSLIQTMLITAFYQVWSEGYWEPYNKARPSVSARLKTINTNGVVIKTN